MNNDRDWSNPTPFWATLGGVWLVGLECNYVRAAFMHVSLHVVNNIARTLRTEGQGHPSHACKFAKVKIKI